MKQKLPEPTTFKEKEAVTPYRLKTMEKSSEAFGGNCLQYICSYYTKIFLMEDNTPSMIWPLGRLTKAFDGNDKIVQLVKIKSATGFFIRFQNRFPDKKIDMLLTIFRRNDVEKD